MPSHPKKKKKKRAHLQNIDIGEVPVLVRIHISYNFFHTSVANILSSYGMLTSHVYWSQHTAVQTKQMPLWTVSLSAAPGSEGYQ